MYLVVENELACRTPHTLAAGNCIRQTAAGSQARSFETTSTLFAPDAQTPDLHTFGCYIPLSVCMGVPGLAKLIGVGASVNE